MNMSPTAAVPNFFTEGSPFLKHPLLTAERTAQEVDFIEDQLLVDEGARILDVGCGFGRHSIELARRGYVVTGIDPSAVMIAEARKRAKQAGVGVDFQQARGEQFATGRPFDAAICLFTSLGQLSEQGENSGLVAKVNCALKANGHFMVEVPQRDTAVRQLKKQEKIGEGARVAFVIRSYDENDHVLSEEFRIVLENEEQTYLLKYKLFDRAELEALLANAGFANILAFGDYKGTSLNAEHAAMVMVARKGS